MAASGHHRSSIGFAVAPGDGLELDQLLKNADLAMYGAKADGRGTYRFFEAGMDARARARRAWNSICVSDQRGGLELYYQPVVDVEDGNSIILRSAVAMAASGTRPDLPGGIHPVAEDTGLINQLACGCSVPPAPRPPPGRDHVASRSTFHPCNSGARHYL